jgi:hypothetical protein
MAIVTIAAPLSGIRGTVAGVVYSANKSGAYAKGWSMPCRPNSLNQMRQRGFVAQAGALWRTLSTAEQADWDTFAATPPETDYNSLGEVYLLSGFGWFSRILLRRMRTGQVEDLIAPANTPTSPSGSFAMYLHISAGQASDATFMYPNLTFQTYYAILILSQAPGLGTNVQTSRYLNMWEAIGMADSETWFGVNYWNGFGVTQIGQRFFGKLYRQSPSGIRSTPLELFTDVIA